MAATLLAGKSLAAQLQQELADQVRQLVAQGGPVPRLAAVLVGHDPASQVYVRNKQRACARAGMQSDLYAMDAETTTDGLLQRVEALNRDPAVHGILVQLPLPKGVDAQKVLDAVDPAKDVDCFHPVNVGLVLQGRPRFLPCTPLGIVQLLAHYQIPVQGQHVVVVGRSDIVGKPLAAMLVQRDSVLGPEMANATVTVAHSRSRDLAQLTRMADILVVAIGQARRISADMVRPGAVVVDVGINRLEEGLVGDVDFDAVRPVASAITPVPGGVGPLTICMLLRNTLAAAQRAR